jgi:hypothetical protein
MTGTGITMLGALETPESVALSGIADALSWRHVLLGGAIRGPDSGDPAPG